MTNKVNNTILGINISHDTSIAVVKNGVLEDVFEEERCRRSKYWAPHEKDDTLLQCIQQKIDIEDIDEVVFTSFDRRTTAYECDSELTQDRLASRKFKEDVIERQLSQDRLKELEEKYEEFNFVPNSNVGDSIIMDDVITQQFDLPKGEYLYNVDHHVHHAWCGFPLSDMDDALIIVMDGGGCLKLWEQYPTHQEIESIYYGQKLDNGDTDIAPLYQKLSNLRFISDLSDQFPNELNQFLMCMTPESTTLDGVDYELVSTPSCGMNFSNMSSALGTDKLGRAAGKVMGMASYGGDLGTNNYNRHTVTHQLELDSLEYTSQLIEKAIAYKPDCKNIILSGGFSLNCTNNYKYLSLFPDHQFFVDPIPHDGGTAAGAALQMYQHMVDGMGDNNNDDEYIKPSVWSESE